MIGKTNAFRPWLVLVAKLVIVPGLAEGAPQTFNTALPVGKGDFIFREQFFYIKGSGDSGTAERNLEVLGTVSVLGFGATSRIALFGALPYLDKALDVTIPGGPDLSRGSSGIGDAQAFVRYTLVQIDRQGSSFRVAPFAGIKLPTGNDDTSDGFGRLPPTLQPGSGSRDLFGGIVSTYQTLDFQADAQLSYKANTAANGFEFGDEFRLDASLQYRLLPQTLDAGVPGFLYGAVEANLLHQTKNESSGISDPDSGGTTLFLSPGLQYVTRRLVLEAIVQYPVVQDLNGAALENDYIVRTGFRVNF